ncbi:hypothetical protein ABZV24_13745 [Streptomyces sp. NPDC005251]|uniref:hypothetical protein n=1 Tax=Streptomyces sp. NPDC005251 TaxID=3157166 RepID=UPI0033A3BA50
MSRWGGVEAEPTPHRVLLGHLLRAAQDMAVEECRVGDGPAEVRTLLQEDAGVVGLPVSVTPVFLSAEPTPGRATA